jgi:hypothetical protein
MMEDSGDPVVRAYDQSGRLAATVTMTPADGDADTWGGDIRDTEALALGPGPTLWVADIGDNSEIRETVVVHALPEPSALGSTTEDAVSYRFRYPAGARDAESFLVDPVDGRVYIATKGFLGGGLYAAPAALTPGATHDLELVERIPAIVSDGAFSPDGTQVVLRTVGLGSETVAYVFDVARGAPDAPIALRSNPRTVPLPAQAQGESVTFTPDATALLVGSEGTDEPIWSVPLPVPTAEPPTAPPTSSHHASGASPAISSTPDGPASDGRGVLPFAYVAIAAVFVVVAALAASRTRQRLR